MREAWGACVRIAKEGRHDTLPNLCSWWQQITCTISEFCERSFCRRSWYSLRCADARWPSRCARASSLSRFPTFALSASFSSVSDAMSTGWRGEREEGAGSLSATKRGSRRLGDHPPEPPPRPGHHPSLSRLSNQNPPMNASSPFAAPPAPPAPPPECLKDLHGFRDVETFRSCGFLTGSIIVLSIVIVLLICCCYSCRRSICRCCRHGKDAKGEHEAGKTVEGSLSRQSSSTLSHQHSLPGFRSIEERIEKGTGKSSLPDGWAAQEDADGYKYFFNQLTRKMSWTHPCTTQPHAHVAASATPGSLLGQGGHSCTGVGSTTRPIPIDHSVGGGGGGTLPAGWVEHVDLSSGCSYYHHAATGQSSWAHPPAADDRK